MSGNPSLNGRFLLRFLIVCFALLLSSPSFAQAADISSYVATNRTAFHVLFDGRNFVPRHECNERCRTLLKKFRDDDFEFLAPMEISKRRNFPALSALRKQCPDAGIAYLSLYGRPLTPTSGFALYEVPTQFRPMPSQRVYLLRNEDYIDTSDKAKGVIVDGTFSVFSYPNCKLLKKIPFYKAGPPPSSNPAEAATDSISEPIIIDDRILIMSLHVQRGAQTQPDPLISLTVWSLTGDARSGDEFYVFGGR